MQSRTGIAVCRHLIEEASAACRRVGPPGMTLLPLDPRCERPWPDWAAVLDSLGSSRAACDRLVVIGAGCLPAGSPRCAEPAVRTVRQSTCFELVTDQAQVDEFVARGCYLVTPGWLSHWRDAVAAWGYDRTTARAHFGEFARTILLLDTGTDSNARSHLHDFARFLALGEEVHRVDLDVFGDRIRLALEGSP